LATMCSLADGDHVSIHNAAHDHVHRHHTVIVHDDFSDGKEENLVEIRNKITIIKGSITDLEVVRKAMHEAEFVLHLAARTSVPRSVKDPLETNRTNVEGTLNVLVAAKELKISASCLPRPPPLTARQPRFPRSKP